MYLKGGEYLGEYSNNEDIAPITRSDNFGLDDYEPEFFLDFLTWKTNGRYQIALKFDDEEFEQDFFYFCHVSFHFKLLFTTFLMIRRTANHQHTDASIICIMFILLIFLDLDTSIHDRKNQTNRIRRW
jgi:hypothetical protein